ncbi:MAG TPA: C-terminal binding protein [Kiloniellales bacterium]|nr:C-terminal binding protein [Kiloniellales bacterium]
MSSLRILCPDAPFADRGLFEQSLAGSDVDFVFRQARALDELPAETLQDCDGVLSWHYIAWPKAAIERLGRCRAIMRSGVGFDHIDIEAAGARGIAVLNTPDYGTGEVADHAMALLLALRRGIASHHDRLRADPLSTWSGWQPPLIKRLRGAALGIVGLGRIGTAFALRARSFGFRILAYDPYIPRGQEIALGVERRDSLEALLAESEIVSLHCPANAETRGMMNGQRFGAMQEGALLINTARGAIVDLDACHRALKSGRLGGAGLDVLPSEPPPADHPLIRAYSAQEDWLRDRLIITPHAAWYAPESWQDMRRLAVERLVAYLRHGEDSCVVNKVFLRKSA